MGMGRNIGLGCPFPFPCLSDTGNFWLDNVNTVVEKVWSPEHHQAAITKIMQKTMQPFFIQIERGRKGTVQSTIQVDHNNAH